jgi:hypothetical protein
MTSLHSVARKKRYRPAVEDHGVDVKVFGSSSGLLLIDPAQSDGAGGPVVPARVEGGDDRRGDPSSIAVMAASSLSAEGDRRLCRFSRVVDNEHGEGTGLQDVVADAPK